MHELVRVPVDHGVEVVVHDAGGPGPHGAPVVRERVPHLVAAVERAVVDVEDAQPLAQRLGPVDGVRGGKVEDCAFLVLELRRRQREPPGGEEATDGVFDGERRCRVLALDSGPC